MSATRVPAWYVRLAFAIATTVGAIGLTAIFEPFLQRAIFLFLFCAVGISSWYGGLRAGLLAAFLGLVGINYLFSEPTGTLLLGRRDLVPFVLFALSSVLLSALSDSLRVARAKAETRERQAAELALQLQEQAVELEQQIEESRLLNLELEERAETARHLTSELEEANRRLEERNREQLAEAQRLAHLGSWEWRIADGRVAWSDEMFRIYGLPPSSHPIAYERFLEMIHPEDRAMVQQVVSGALQRGEPFEMEHRIVRPDGSVRLLEGRGKVVTDASGTITGMVGTGQDVTEQRMIEAAARRALQAEAANEAKMAFLATMSHELRTPLNAIAGYVELLVLGVHGPITDQQRDDLQRIQRAQKHLLGLINDILNFVKLDAGRVPIELAAVSVSETLAGIGALVTPQVRAKGLDYRFLPADDALHVRADREKLVQVLLNLLSNAVKFTPAGGSITLSAHASDGTVAIQVADTGIGIPPDKLEVIFDPFVQVSGSFTRTAEGAGLGLAISRELARAMGGEISVESALGVGSTFTVRLEREVPP